MFYTTAEGFAVILETICAVIERGLKRNRIIT